MDSLESTPSIMATPSTPSRRLNKRERLKMISQLSILDASTDGKINVSLKIEDCPLVDDSSLILLSMPDGPFISKELFKPSFHPFVITVQNGQRVYGGSYIFGFRQLAKHQSTDDEEKDNGSQMLEVDSGARFVYISRALVAITVRPMVDQLHKLLEWCVNEGGCNPKYLRCLANCRLPVKGKVVQIRLPNFKYISSHQAHDIIEVNNISGPVVSSLTETRIEIYRSFSVLPLFDYSYRALLSNILTIDTLLLVFICALNEVQILISSESYYNLMLVAESVISLLNPFKWQHVYVPILPKKLGFHYLDAPTPFIMGISSKTNPNSTERSIKSNRFACYVDCDKRQVDLNMDQSSLFEPPFIDELRTELYELIKNDPRLNSTILPKSDAFKRVTDLVNRYSFMSEPFSYMDEQKFNQNVRILFFKKLKKNILNKHQHFIALSSPGTDPRREQVKFDTVSYLSDQPLPNRPFLQNFVETQMFASFIDEAGKQLLRKQKQQSLNVNHFDNFLIEDDLEDVDFELYTDSVLESRFTSPILVNLHELDELPASHIPVAMSPRRRPQQRFTGNPNISGISPQAPPSPAKMVSTALTAQTNWKVVEALLREIRNKTKKILLVKMGTDEVGAHAGQQPQSIEENTLIAGLCDLIERIWSHARAEDSEDIGNWESSKCPFWSHLVAFHERFKDSGMMDSSNLNSRLYGRKSSSRTSLCSVESEEESNQLTWSSLKKRIDSLSQLSLNDNRGGSYGFASRPKLNGSATKSIPTTLIYDFESICDMTDIKTDIGKSRAFIRLSLERKLLSKHLRTLLYNQELLQSLYKRYAFLRCEEEREQFITHLLTLNAVDLSCFTNTFTTSLISYTLVISSTTAFTGWISICGNYGSTAEPLRVEENHFRFKHKNFGFITGIFLQIPSTGQKVYVEQCFLRNNITNTLYKFECNSWLGLQIDDCSLERFLVGSLINGSINDHLMKRSSSAQRTSITRNWNRPNDGRTGSGEEKFSAEDLQTMLGECSNQILKLYFNDENSGFVAGSTFLNTTSSNTATPSRGGRLSNSSSGTLQQRSRNRQQAPNSMISLFFGDSKLLWILTQIFYYGFKNRRTFRRQTWAWDYILKVQVDLQNSQNLSSSERVYAKDFISLVNNINSKCQSYGKEMRFQIFLLISIRERLLSPHFLKLLSKPAWASTRYDNESFFRNGMLFTFLTEILQTFNELDFKFEPYLTKNL